MTLVREDRYLTDLIKLLEMHSEIRDEIVELYFQTYKTDYRFECLGFSDSTDITDLDDEDWYYIICKLNDENDDITIKICYSNEISILIGIELEIEKYLFENGVEHPNRIVEALISGLSRYPIP